MGPRSGRMERSRGGEAGSWVFQAPIETNTNIVAAKMSIVIGLLRVGVLSGCSHHNEMKLKLKHISTRR